MLALSDQEIDGLKLDADLAFPSNIREALTKWRVGLPAVIDDREVQVVQGTTAHGATATLSFDMETGLLRRQMRYVDSPVGRIPTQIDYEEHRWRRREDTGSLDGHVVDGRDVFEIKDVQPNVAIDATRFARPRAREEIAMVRLKPDTTVTTGVVSALGRTVPARRDTAS